MKSNTFDMNKQGNVSKSYNIIVPLIKDHNRKRATEIAMSMAVIPASLLCKYRDVGMIQT
jgi:hypothetical protein